MLRSCRTAFSLCLAVAAGAATAQEPGEVTQGVVVELFTSQGCSSCPPADAFLGQLTQRTDVIPLSLHVDYWDYIGWRDRYGQPQFTERQKSYARAEGSRSIYTPQMIVGGQRRVEGFLPDDIVAAIDEQVQVAAGVAMRLARSGAMIEVVVEADPPLDREVALHLVRYIPTETMTIRGGENAGRTVTYHNIVTTWERLGTWDGVVPTAFHVRAEGEDPVVVIVQEPGPGPILAAARLR